jgi:cellulose synthase (UDP-forming)
MQVMLDARDVRNPAPQPPDTASQSAAIPMMRVFSGWRGVVNAFGIAVWFASLLYFWLWWLQPEHVIGWGRYATVTVVLAWITLVPAYAVAVFAIARIPAGTSMLPHNARVAIVVTKAPSEPWDVARRTLEGALRQNSVVHDTWLADEDPTPEALAWCRQNGVKVSTRKGVAEYHRSTWPRRTRCKEGNLAYFYDRHGYANYDFVAQFDVDHVPQPDYLSHAIAPFADSSVGYVSAPSICSANASRSWSARGRLYVEASLHGTLQAGYNAWRSPLCIGSHYTVRTSALKAIGGLGPELAEDHSTSLLMNAGGWNGVHAIDAIAYGDGPETFADLATQEFQWSRSLVTILLVYTPRYMSGLHGYKRFLFLFSQTWYPLYSSMSAAMFVMPIFALLTGRNFSDVTYVDFFIHGFPLSFTLVALAYWWRSSGSFRPARAKILSWEGIAFMFLRWPWSLLGSLVAVWDRMTGSFVDFSVTPKRSTTKTQPGLRTVAPYAVLALASALPAWGIPDAGSAGGFYLYCLLNAVLLEVFIVFILLQHAVENRVSPIRFDAGGLAILASVAIAGFFIVSGAYNNGTKGLAAMNVGITAFTLTRTVYLPAGAGMGTPGKTIIYFDPKWHGFSTGKALEPEREGN